MEAHPNDRVTRLEVTMYGNGDKDASVVARIARNTKAVDELWDCVEPQKGCLDDRIKKAVVEGMKGSNLRYILDWITRLAPVIAAIALFIRG